MWKNLTAKSPDLNLTEHWSSHPISVSHLTNFLLEEWLKIPLNALLNLVEVLLRRGGAVTPVIGGPTSH